MCASVYTVCVSLNARLCLNSAVYCFVRDCVCVSVCPRAHMRVFVCVCMCVAYVYMPKSVFQGDKLEELNGLTDTD